MKFFHEIEDCIIGIIIGLLLIGLSGRYIQLPELNIIWGLLFIVSLVFTVLDVVYTFMDFGGHLLLIIILFVNNAIDLIIELALAIKYLNLEITLPLVSQFMPLLDNPTTLFIIGIFFIASSIFWMIVFPFMQ